MANDDPEPLIDPNEDSGAAVPSYRGYEFQIEGSTYLALDFIFRRRWTGFVDIEPIGGEDAAATVGEREARPVWLGVPGPAALRVQIKAKSTGHWTKATFDDVLNGKTPAEGKTPRKTSRIYPAAALKADPNARFLFLTDAQVESKVAYPRLDALDTLDPADAANPSRILILDRHTRSYLLLLTQQLLRDTLYVPLDAIPAAIKELKDEVRARLLDARSAGRRWDRKQIAQVIERHGGRPDLAVRPPPVFPTNFQQILQQFRTRHALLLTGPTGVGKTLLAEHLVALARQDGLDIQRPQTPAELKRQLNHGGGTKLYYVEDPWGKYAAAAGADLWESELPGLMNRATSANQILVTSRTGILSEQYLARLPESLRAANVGVDESHYPHDLRLRILRQESEGLDPWHRDLLIGREPSVVRQLPVPLSVQSFVAQLRGVTPDEQARPDLDDLIRQSNVETIGNTLVKEIESYGRDQVAAAVALWVLLMSQRTVTEVDTDGLGDLMVGGGWTGAAPEVRTLVDRLVASRAAEWSGDVLRLHPTRLEGLERLTARRPDLLRRIVMAVLTGLQHRDGVGAAADAVRALHGRKLPIPSSVRTALPEFWIEQLRGSDVARTRTAYDELAAPDMPELPVVVLIRALRKPPTGRNGFGPLWRPPELTDTQRAAVRASDDARAAAGVFVRTVLPNDYDTGRYRWEDLHAFFSGFGWDLSGDFLLAAEEALTVGWPDSNADLLVQGALASDSPQAYDRLARATAAAHEQVEQWWRDGQQEYRRASQGELDADYATHIMDEPGERFYAVNRIFKVLFRHRRKRDGLAWIKGDALRDHFLPQWSKALSIETRRAVAQTSMVPGTIATEWDALYDACGGDTDPYWSAAAECGYRGAVRRVLDALRTMSVQDLSGWASAAAAVLNPTNDAAAIQQAITDAPAVPPARRLAFAYALRVQATERGRQASATSPLEGQLLHGHEADGLDACVYQADALNGKAKSAPQRLSAAMVGLLTDVATDLAHPLAAFALHALATAAQDVSALLPAFLQSADDAQRRLTFPLAVRAGGSTREAVARAVSDDTDHDCRREAMAALALSATPDEIDAIVRRANDPSGDVRKGCAALIGDFKWPQGLPALVALLKDTHNSGSDVIRGSLNYTVARAAADALAGFGDLPNPTIVGVVDFLSVTTTTPDLILHCNVVTTLAGLTHPLLVPLFAGLLASDARWDGAKGTGFPVRYAAAWALVRQFQHADRREPAAIEALALAARHSDVRLAGPAIIALAMAGESAHVALTDAFSRPTGREDTAVLALVAAAWAGAAPAPLTDRIVPDDHPARQVIVRATKLISQDGADVADAMKQWSAANGLVAEWLGRIADGDGLHSAIRSALARLTRDRTEAFVRWRDGRAQDFG